MKLCELEKLFENLKKRLVDSSDAFIYEMVFFKAYVTFEVFICELFSDYATGVRNERFYIPPTRELQFKDKETLEKFLKINKSYTEYFKVAEENGELFFSPNPFSILKDPTYSQYLLEMKLIRNVIAHNSPEAIGKYEKSVLNRSFIEPGVFLAQVISGSSKTKLENYLISMLEVAEKTLVNA